MQSLWADLISIPIYKFHIFLSHFNLLPHSFISFIEAIKSISNRLTIVLTTFLSLFQNQTIQHSTLIIKIYQCPYKTLFSQFILKQNQNKVILEVIETTKENVLKCVRVFFFVFMRRLITFWFSISFFFCIFQIEWIKYAPDDWQYKALFKLIKHIVIHMWSNRYRTNQVNSKQRKLGIKFNSQKQYFLL